MKKSLKIIAVFTVSLICLLAVGVSVFLLQFDASRYKDTIVALVEEQSGREFAIEGDIRVAPSLLPTLVAEQVTLANPGWAREPQMLSVERLEAQISLLSLLRGDIALHRIALLAPVINLEARENGNGNWQFDDAADVDKIRDQANDQDLPYLDIRELHVERADISYLGAQQEKPVGFTIETLNADLTGLEKVLKISLDAGYENIPFTVNGTIGSLARLGSESPYPVSLDIRAGAARGQIEGRIENPARFTGIEASLQLQAESLARFNEFTRQSWPEIGPFKLRTDIGGDLKNLRLSSLDARLADSTVAGEASLSLAGSRPQLRAQLQSSRLDLVPFQPEKKQEKQKNEKVFSSQKFDLAGLGAVDADISLKAGRVDTRQAQIRDLDLTVKLDKGVLSIKPVGRIADGSMDADIRLNSASGPPTLEARLNVKNMLPEQLPLFSEDPVIRDGRTDIQFKGSGTGPSPAAMAASLDGKLLVTIGKGQLLNNMADLAGSDVIFSTFQMLNPLSEKEEHSTLNCGVLNFDIQEGIARAKNGIALQTDKVNVLGSGVVDLKTEQIDFRAKPRAREGLGVNLAQLGDVMHIGGTLSNPRPQADVKGALRTAGTVGAAVATGGISLLAEGLFNRTFATDDPCAVALGKKPSGNDRKAGASGSTEKDKPREDKNTLEKAGDAVKGMFDGMFGD